MAAAPDSSSMECFVIMPISDQAGYESGHFSEVYRDLIVPAVENCGFSASRADKVMKANNIHIDILTRLRRAPLAICDISARNPNVFFELAFRQAFDMPTVVIKDEKTENPFDVISIRHIGYDSRLKYNDVMEKRDEISVFIRETLKDPKHNSLISLLSIGEKASIVESKKTPEIAALEVLSNKIDGIYSRIVAIESINRDDIKNLEYQKNIVRLRLLKDKNPYLDVLNARTEDEYRTVVDAFNELKSENAVIRKKKDPE